MKSANTGAKQFVSFVNDWGHPEWVVLAVEAPIEQVRTAFARLHKPREEFAEVSIKTSQDKNEEIAPLIALIRPKNSAWTVIYRTICLPLEESDFRTAARDAAALSSKLQSRALMFVGADTSHSMSSVVWRNGKKVEEKDWASQLNSTDKFFSAVGVYLPVCFPCRAGDGPWLAVRTESAGRIERAAIISLEPPPEKPSPNVKELKKLTTKLLRAGLGGNVGQINKLIEAGADVNRRDDHYVEWDGFTPVIAAAFKGRVDAVKILLAAGAKVDVAVASGQSEWEGSNALALAAYNGHLSVVKELLKAGANVKSDSEEFGTAIQHAAEKDRLEIVRALLQAGATLTRHAVNRAVGRAARTGNLSILKELFKNKSRKEIPFTPKTISLAIPSDRWSTPKQVQTIKVLLAAGADINGGDWEAFKKCIAQRNAELLRFLLESGAEVNVDPKSTSTPLHYAAFRDWLEGARMLVKAGAKLDSRNLEGRTPAQWAKFHSSKEVLRYLEQL